MNAQELAKHDELVQKVIDLMAAGYRPTPDVPAQVDGLVIHAPGAILEFGSFMERRFVEFGDAGRTPKGLVVLTSRDFAETAGKVLCGSRHRLEAAFRFRRVWERPSA